ncbi:class I adenylate-forming enzyme family protein [Xanthobacter pseudotagetidis]|uniref:class I adenylate-forming enzyme family protein n=1 Tax=Xanthobacter pseudotagetidis TaxID=3119911 RepID=UPI00372C3DFB
MRLEVFIEAHALRRPDHPAVICGGERLTYGQLQARITALAGAMSARGVRPGDRVLLYLSNGTAFVELTFAALSLGAIVVPATTRLTDTEVAYIAADAEPRLVAHDGAGTGLDLVRRAAEGAIFLSAGAATGGDERLEDWRAEPVMLRPDVPVEWLDAMIMYTSGTTGRPKGALLTHANIITNHHFVNGLEWGLAADDVFLVSTPLAHRTGFARLANALTVGGTLVVMEKFDPAATLDIIAREKVSVAGMVPTICRMMLPAIAAAPHKCASLRRIVVTGEAFPVELKQQLIGLLPHVRLFSFFAMTEAGAITGLDHEEQFTHPASVGRPTPGVEVKLVDAEGAHVPDGEVGEIAVRTGAPGQSLTLRGYFRRPKETAETIRDGWVHTGDMARRDADGFLYIVDRKKDMVLSGGFNIYTKEVEQTLIAHPSVADAAVVGIPDAIYGEAVVAFVEPRAGQEPSEEALIAHCRTLIAGYKKPKRVLFVEQLPRNALGKVLKTELRRQAVERCGAPGTGKAAS